MFKSLPKYFSKKYRIHLCYVYYSRFNYGTNMSCFPAELALLLSPSVCEIIFFNFTNMMLFNNFAKTFNRNLINLMFHPDEAVDYWQPKVEKTNIRIKYNNENDAICCRIYRRIFQTIASDNDFQNFKNTIPFKFA